MNNPDASRAIADFMREIQFARKMGDADPEGSHIVADQALIKFLRNLGFYDVADAWEEVEKWYA